MQGSTTTVPVRDREMIFVAFFVALPGGRVHAA